jgi:hypothetical protein
MLDSFRTKKKSPEKSPLDGSLLEDFAVSAGPNSPLKPSSDKSIYDDETDIVQHEAQKRRAVRGQQVVPPSTAQRNLNAEFGLVELKANSTQKKSWLDHARDGLGRVKLKFGSATSAVEMHSLPNESDSHDAFDAPASSYARVTTQTGNLNSVVESLDPTPVTQSDVAIKTESPDVKADTNFDPIKVGIGMMLVGGALIGGGVACGVVTPPGAALITMGTMVALMGLVLFGVGCLLKYLSSRPSSARDFEVERLGIPGDDRVIATERSSSIGITR